MSSALGLFLFERIKTGQQILDLTGFSV